MNKQELLDYAKKHYTTGTKFKSSLSSDNGKIRTVLPYADNKIVTWEIDSEGNVRSDNGLKPEADNGEYACSNPVIYSPKKGWVEIIETKYTPQYIKDNKIAVIVHSLEQANKMAKAWGGGDNYYINTYNEHMEVFCKYNGRPEYVTKTPGWYERNYGATKTIDFSQVNFNEMDKKIVGYKCPTDLFNGKVKKGTIYKEYKLGDNIYMCPEGKSSSESLAPEIVETWEAVFAGEEKKTIKVGTKQLEVVVHKDGKCECDGKTFMISDIIRLNNEVKWSFASYLPWDTKVEQVKIGCNSLDKEDLQSIVDCYDSLN